MNNSNKYNGNNKTSKPLKNALLLLLTASSLFSCGTTEKNATPTVYEAFCEATYYCKNESVSPDGTLFSFKDSYFEIEKSNATPKVGQITTYEDPNVFNGGLLITFKGSILETVLFGEPIKQYEIGFLYKFDLEEKSYGMYFEAEGDSVPRKCIDVIIFDYDDYDGIGRGYDNFLSEGSFLLK